MQNKVYKIVTDQAANNIKAFGNEKEFDKSDEIIKLTTELLMQQKRLDLHKQQELL